MQKSKFNIVLDQSFGSSGKGLVSTYLAHKHNINHVSSANYPNAGHTSVIGQNKFVAKAIPTAACLKKVFGQNIDCYISPGSGFDWKRLIQEWEETARPRIFIHARASIVGKEHKAREESGKDSTKHIASTMQGTAAALSDKILRKPCVELAGVTPEFGDNTTMENWLDKLCVEDSEFARFIVDRKARQDILDKIQIVDSQEFRNMTWNIINQGDTWLHEGSQGYALSVDHGAQYPYTTSRNCTLQAAMDYMAIPPSLVGDVYLNFRSYPIRVGNVVENDIEKGNSGRFYPDSQELTWDEVARRAGMPDEERAILAERERTTVTRRVRRVATFSWDSVLDSVRVNGATKLCVNFIQYINWKDAFLRGGKEAFNKLSHESREFITKLEEIANLPVVLIGTGADNSNIIDLE